MTTVEHWASLRACRTPALICPIWIADSRPTTSETSNVQEDTSIEEFEKSYLWADLQYPEKFAKVKMLRGFKQFPIFATWTLCCNWTELFAICGNKNGMFHVFLRLLNFYDDQLFTSSIFCELI